MKWASSSLETALRASKWLLQQGHTTRVKKMKSDDLRSMSVDELWSLHELIASVLTRNISAEKVRLDDRMRELTVGTSDNSKRMHNARRPYPRVFPKYRNPAQPAETWAGRGKQPRWLTAQLRSGKKLEDFRIEPMSDRAPLRARR